VQSNSPGTLRKWKEEIVVGWLAHAPMVNVISLAELSGKPRLDHWNGRAIYRVVFPHFSADENIKIRQAAHVDRTRVIIGRIALHGRYRRVDENECLTSLTIGCFGEFVMQFDDRKMTSNVKD
jgi:hypothetical protein